MWMMWKTCSAGYFNYDNTYFDIQFPMIDVASPRNFLFCQKHTAHSANSKITIHCIARMTYAKRSQFSISNVIDYDCASGKNAKMNVNSKKNRKVHDPIKFQKNETFCAQKYKQKYVSKLNFIVNDMQLWTGISMHHVVSSMRIIYVKKWKLFLLFSLPRVLQVSQLEKLTCNRNTYVSILTVTIHI